MTRQETQKKAMKSLMLAGGSISRLEAINRYGIGNLPSIINRLRKDGFPVRTTKVQVGNISFARYDIPKSRIDAIIKSNEIAV